MMITLGGTLYAGVYEGLNMLSKKYKLFLLSNCGVSGLKNFMEYTYTSKFFTDTITYGVTNLQ